MYLCVLEFQPTLLKNVVNHINVSLHQNHRSYKLFYMNKAPFLLIRNLSSLLGSIAAMGIECISLNSSLSTGKDQYILNPISRIILRTHPTQTIMKIYWMFISHESTLALIVNFLKFRFYKLQKRNAKTLLLATRAVRNGPGRVASCPI